MLLQGHNSPETAYVVDDYPYGFRLRCKIRYWIETATKGQMSGKQRLCSQTTNPKKPLELWNKPRYGTYSALLVMFLDGENHVATAAVHAFSGPEEFATFETVYGPDLNDEQRKRLTVLKLVSRRYSPNSWAEWETKNVPLLNTPPPPINQTP